MSQTPLSQPNQSQNRIRDNQRRSRARKKEYLQELETKYRTCEQVGAEASAEIQAAARRVLEENRKLVEENARLRKGLDAIKAGNMLKDGQVPCEGHGLGARELEGLLKARKQCGGDQEGRRWSCGPSISCQDIPTPTSTNQDVVVATATASPAIGPTLRPAYPDASPVYAHPARYEQPYIQHQQWTAPSPWQQATVDGTPNSSFSSSNNFAMQSATPQSQDMSSYYAQPLEQAYNEDSSSCQTAAQLIYSLNPKADPADLERAFGCSRAGVDCSVRNAKVFEVMDRFGG